MTQNIEVELKIDGLHPVYPKVELTDHEREKLADLIVKKLLAAIGARTSK